MMDIDKLQELLTRERDFDNLQPLPQDFIDSFKNHVRDLRQQASKSASYKERDMLYDELKSTIQLYNNLMSVREAKLQGLVGLPAPAGIMLEHEARFWETCCRAINDYKCAVAAPVDEAYKLAAGGRMP